ncbi:MAG: putative glycoside hydrolase [Candidatus Pacebacteria bacterium]|nr:putative glycoside hydrolase [Candidatus Paceibacterota bacterium]
MSRIMVSGVFLLAISGVFLLGTVRNNIALTLNGDELIQPTEAEAGEGADVQAPVAVNPNLDIEPQKPLENPPQIIKALYSTAWSASSAKKIDYFINFMKDTELNALVVDIKDYSGTVAYRMDVEAVKKYGADKSIKITKINSLIKKLHDNGIYAIARIAVFQDPILAKNRPEIALQSIATGKTWEDKKGLEWVDPASKEAWDYNISIAQDALNRGFDEVNFDYVRFASDGNMKDARYPVWDGKTPKHTVIKNFFEYLRNSLGTAKISLDLFGLVTVNHDDLGIGQKMEDAFPYADAIAPMVYPSHYMKGFAGYQSPAKYPYEIVYKSMSDAQERLDKYLNSTTTPPTNVPQLRPWLQDFDLGAIYTADKIEAQIHATEAAATSTPMGWMLWDPANTYTTGVFPR